VDSRVLARVWALGSGVVYVKTTKRENKSGTVRYLHLAHNERDPVKARAVPRVLSPRRKLCYDIGNMNFL
jgi:hypothetical protein